MERVDHAGITDDELMARLCRRDLAAFGALYDRYSDLVYSVSLRVVADPHVAQDVTQDVFLRVWRRPEQFDVQRGKFVTWLLSVARNRSIDERRSQGRRLRREALPAAASEVEDVLPSTDVRDDPALATVLADERRAVRKALEVLPPEQKLAIQLAYFGGLTQQEIAEKLSTPLGTVKTRIRLGMQKMRVVLEERRRGDRGS
jgi:RNA polymerase sigma-70 factor (ECF subfamily)